MRAFKGVGGKPLFIEHADGAYLYDVDGNRYIDYVGSWGPQILGHRHPAVEQAICDAAQKGTSFGAPAAAEVEMAELLHQLVPGLEMVRMVNSGTEATMSAVRLARAFTGRDLVIKFNGCYHGHGDSFLIAAGSGVATLSIPGSPGVPRPVAELTSVAEYNDLDGVTELVRTLGPEQVAAIIVEPVAGNMGLVLPRGGGARRGFLHGLRELCDRHGILLVLDEVMTGFRVALGGAAERFGVQGDLVTLGKVIGGGLPVGAFGGRAEIMKQLAPLGPVYQAGTLSGNPLAMAAGVAALRVLRDTDPYPELEERSQQWVDGFAGIAHRTGEKLVSVSCGAMVGIWFASTLPVNFQEAKGCDTVRFGRFFHEMLSEGVYLAPSPFEANFLSTAHTADVISQTLERAERAISRL